MAKVLHTCSGCVPIDASIIDVYTQLISASVRAEAAAKKADEASLGKAPYVGENGNWWEWDEQQKAFVDTGIQAETGMVVDDQMSDTSTYPVQNKVVKEYIDEHTASDPDAVKYTEQSLTAEQKAQARTNIGAGTSDFSGSYNDLSNKPAIPSVPVISTDIETDKNSDAKTASPKAVHDLTGSLADLNTTAKGSLVEAINEAAQSGGGSGDDPEAVKYTAQSLTDSQKTQARTNIGAGTYSKPSSGIPASDLADGVIPDVSGKQDTLVSGTNIKTINQTSLLGSGDLTIADGADGVGFESIETPSTADGTALITLTNGDTITLDLNHQHTQYPKYVYCATQAAYEAITTKESDTLYLILESN